MKSIDVIKETEAAKNIHKHLKYNPDTGEFIWVKPTAMWIKPGNIAGGLNPDGYIYIRYNNRGFLAHRLAWYLTYGYFPENDIDHINNIKTDNRISNLREVSRSCNMQNQKVRSSNTSGITGVCFAKHRGKWRAYIRIQNKLIHLGLYHAKLDAALARFNAELVLDNWTCDATSKTYTVIRKLWPEYECPYLTQSL